MIVLLGTAALEVGAIASASSSPQADRDRRGPPDSRRSRRWGADVHAQPIAAITRRERCTTTDCRSILVHGSQAAPQGQICSPDRQPDRAVHAAGTPVTRAPGLASHRRRGPSAPRRIGRRRQLPRRRCAPSSWGTFRALLPAWPGRRWCLELVVRLVRPPTLARRGEARVLSPAAVITGSSCGGSGPTWARPHRDARSSRRCPPGSPGPTSITSSSSRAP